MNLGEGMTFDGRLFSGITVLAAVAESGSFVRAADALGLSPSGVSRAVSRLEKRVGVRLLDRTTRSQTMTDEGRRLYESVVPHLTGIEEAASAASGSANVVQGKLRVNVDPFFSRTVLASRLPDFLAHHPDLSLELIMRDDVGDLVADGFDLAVRFGPPPMGTLVVASPRYVAEHGKPANPEDVRKHQRIMFYNPVTAKPFEWEFHRGKKVTEIPAEGRLLVSDVETMLGACIAGAGIAQVMEIGVEQVMRDGLLVDIFPDWSDERFPLYALFPSRRHRAAKVEAFIKFCLESLSAATPVTPRQMSLRGERRQRKR
jgi:DNA-binding transcriptional LysR family regulator